MGDDEYSTREKLGQDEFVKNFTSAFHNGPQATFSAAIQL
jgi:hypothetical protein